MELLLFASRASKKKKESDKSYDPITSELSIGDRSVSEESSKRWVRGIRTNNSPRKRGIN